MGTLRRSTSAYYRFLSEGKWRQPVLTRALFDLIVKTFKLSELTLVVDDTLCPKWGRKIFGTGTFFDHTARPRAGFVWGHNWVVMAIVVRSTAGAAVALPFWIKLYRQKKECVDKSFFTRLELTSSMLEIIRVWFSGPIRLLADGAYANRTLALPAQRLSITLISRLRSDACLRAPTPARRSASQRGRSPKHGRPLPKLAILSATLSAFHEQKVDIYGHRVSLLVREVVAYWPAIDSVIKVVITRDPKRPKRIPYLVTTNIALEGRTVIEGFAQRWSIEQLFSGREEPHGPGHLRSSQAQLGSSSCRSVHRANYLDRGVDVPPQSRSMGAALRSETRRASLCDHHPDPFRVRPSGQGIKAKCSTHRGPLHAGNLCGMKEPAKGQMGLILPRRRQRALSSPRNPPLQAFPRTRRACEGLLSLCSAHLVRIHSVRVRRIHPG